MFRLSRLRPPLRECTDTDNAQGKIRRIKPQWIGLGLYIFALTSNLLWLVSLTAFHNNWQEHNNAIYIHTSFPFWFPLMEFYMFACVAFLLYLILLGTACAFALMEATTALEFQAEHLFALAFAAFGPWIWFVGYWIGWDHQFYLVTRISEVIIPILQLTLCAILVPLVSPITLFIFRSDSRKKTFSRFFIILVLYMILYSAPLWISSVHILDKPLPDKPLIVGHRGAPYEAPENTLPSFQAALDLGVDIIESDVTISLDGVPFMSHLGCLKGTTNIETVFPNRVLDHASNFTLSELKKLDASAWWPGRRFKGTKIPTLQETINLMQRHHNKKARLMFDLIPLHKKHPFHGKEKEIIFQIVQQSNFSNQFVWLQISEYQTPLNAAHSAELKDRLPGALIASGAELADLSLVLDHSIDAINFQWDSPNSFITPLSHYNASIVYLVNERWLFDQMWCLGVRRITTNYPRYFLNSQSPFWVTTRSDYIFAVRFFETLCAVLTIWLSLDTFLTAEHSFEVPGHYRTWIAKRETKIWFSVVTLLILFIAVTEHSSQ